MAHWRQTRTHTHMRCLCGQQLCQLHANEYANMHKWIYVLWIVNSVCDHLHLGKFAFCRRRRKRPLAVVARHNAIQLSWNRCMHRWPLIEANYIACKFMQDEGNTKTKNHFRGHEQRKTQRGDSQMQVTDAPPTTNKMLPHHNRIWHENAEYLRSFNSSENSSHKQIYSKPS